MNIVTGYGTTHGSPGLEIWSLSNEQLYIVHNNESVKMGRCQFTPAGEELSKLCIPLESPDGFADYIVSVWESEGLRVTRSLPEALTMNQQAQPSEA